MDDKTLAGEAVPAPLIESGHWSVEETLASDVPSDFVLESMPIEKPSRITQQHYTPISVVPTLARTGDAPWPSVADESDWQASELDQSTSAGDTEQTLGTRVFGPARSTHASTEARFRILRPLGEGQVGHVFLAFDNDIGREVAIKFYGTSSASQAEHIAREVRITGRVAHSGAAPLYDVGQGDDGRYYCIMKHLSGFTLGQVIDLLRSGDQAMHLRFSFHQRASLMMQLLRTLVATHRTGIIHRDIKPNNILIGPTGELTLIDWSIAIDLKEDDGAGPIRGTPAYMAPEQARGEPVDARTDLYGVGATLYEFLSLSRPAPHDQGTLRAYLKAIEDFDPPNVDTIPSQIQGFVPSEFRNLVNKAIARSPSDRYDSAVTMLEALQIILNGQFEAVCPRTNIKSRLHRFMRWLDIDPYRNIRIVRGMAVGTAFALLGLGVLIGSYLVGP